MNYYEPELRRINISAVGFHWQEEKAVFPGWRKSDLGDD